MVYSLCRNTAADSSNGRLQMKRLCRTIWMLFMFTTAHAGELTKEQWLLEGVNAGLYYMDYKQTLDLKNHPGMYEMNPVLGKHPSDSKVRNYFAANLVGHTVITALLPEKYRPIWQWSTITVELIVVRHNASLGIHAKF